MKQPLIHKWFALIPALLVVLAACSPLGEISGPTLTPVPPTAPASTSALTVSALRNAAYRVEGFDGTWRTFNLVDGVYQSSADPTSPDYVNLSLLDDIAFGDLNADGLEDAAAFLAVNYGGTGVFVSLVAMLNQAGTPTFTASTLIDDRPNVRTIAIQDGKILLQASIHGPQDAMCCPSLATAQTYYLDSGQLVLAHYTSWPGDSQHDIQVTSPVDGAQVSNPFTITGDVTVAPFENTLGYRIVLPDGTLVNQSSVMVDTPDMGVHGTFSLILDLSNAGIQGRFRVDIFETSAANGATLALTSVNLSLP